MQPVVAEIFQISRFNLVLEVFPTLREALASVSPQAAAGLRARLTRCASASGARAARSRSSPHRRRHPRQAGPRAPRRPRDGASIPTARRRPSSTQSLPAGLGHTYGGHSSCVELDTGDDGVLRLRHGQRRARLRRPRARPPGAAARRRCTSSCRTCTGTTSWASRSSGPPTCRSTRLRIYGCHDELEHAFRRQQDAPSFPVPFSTLGADIEFIKLEPGAHARGRAA